MAFSFSHFLVGASSMLLGVVDADCIGRMAPTLFRDMHDGDTKVITADIFDFQIQSGNASENWTVNGKFDVNCVATVDFRVPGKPNPPPVNLTMTEWIMQSTDMSLNLIGFEFTDPSGTLAPPSQPVNFWVMEKWPKPPLLNKAEVNGKTCLYTPLFKRLVVNDMHDGDKKSLKDHGDSLDIIPYGTKESWKVDAKFGEDCVARVDFDVQGKPNPPPVPLNAQVWGMASISGADKNAILFTDPSGTIASPHTTLNAWIPSNADKTAALVDFPSGVVV